MALSAFGDELHDDTVQAPRAATPQPPAVSSAGLSAFGDELHDEPSQARPGTEANTSFGTLNRDPSGAVVGNQPTAAPVQGPWLDVPNSGMTPSFDFEANPSMIPGTNGLPDFAGDTGRAVARGVVGLSEAGVGLADIASGGAAGNALQKYAGYDPQAARQQINAQDSPGRQQSQAALDNAQGATETLKALYDNPSNIPYLAIESLPSMLLGGVAGRGVGLGAKALGLGAPTAGLIGAGAGEGLVAAGQQAEQTRQQTGTLNAKQTALAVGSGALTGLLGAAGAKIGRALGVADIDAQLAGANGADVARGMVSRALIGTGLETLEELSQSGQQQVLTNIATDRPVLEGVTKQMVVGGAVGAAMGGAAGLRRPELSNGPQQETPAPNGMASRFEAMMQRLTQKPAAQAPDAQAPAAAQGPEPQATPALPIVEAPAQPQAVPAQPVEPPTPFARSADINPLLDNLGVQGDARAKTLDLLRPAEAEVDAKRRGVLPMAEQQRLASLIGLQGPQADHFARQIGQAHNAETIIAMTNGVSDRLQNVLEQQQRIASGQASDIDKAEFVQSVAELKGVFGDLMGARAESGRALAAQRRQVYNIQQAQQILEGIGGGAQGADDLATAIGKAVQSGGVGNAAKLINAPQGKMARLLGYYYRAALLSGIRTHAVNITSNSVTLANEVIERGIAAGVGGAKRAVGLKGQTVFAEPLDLLIGMAKGSAKAGASAYNSFRTGDSPMLGGGKQETSAIDDMNRPRPAGAMATAGWLADKAASVPYRALGAEDAFFATLNYEAELRTLARQTALAEKKLGQLPAGAKLSQRIEQLVQDPTPGMIESAGEHARVQTFNQKAGTYAQAIMSAKAKAPWLNLIVPFVRTPANIVKFGLKRTPIAPLFKDVREDIMAGGAKQERAIARILWGSSVMVAAGMAAQAGYVTGAGPDDKKEKAALLASGWRPYSIKVGDTYHEYSRLDPFSQWLGLASDMATQDYTHKGAGDVAANLLGSVVNNTVNKTYMQGLSNFVEFLDDPKRNGPWYLRQMGGTVAQPFTLLSNAASEGDAVGREQNSVLDAIKYRLPGLRSTLPEKLDAFGAPVPNRTYPGGPFSIAAPIAQSEQSQDPVRREAARLGWQPSVPDKAITLKGTKHELSDDQHHEMRQLVGRLSYDVAKRVMSAPGWKSLGDDQRRELLDKATAKARTAVRMAFVPLVATGNRAAVDKLSKAIKGESK